MSCRVSGAVSREHWRLSNDFRFQRIVDRQARTAVPAGDRILESTPFERPVRTSVGTWLSLVEHSLGVRGVGSSNLPVPTNFAQVLRLLSQNRGEARPPAAARRSPTSPSLGNCPKRGQDLGSKPRISGVFDSALVPKHAHAERWHTKRERRRLERENKNRQPVISSLRRVVYLVPVACLISLCWHVAARRLGVKEDGHSPERQALLMDDWSLRRADMERWMERQPSRQLVFVRYGPRHNVNFEWVYNHADIMGSHVMWARDLGIEHNKLLLNLVPDRTVWLLEADAHDPQLVPYSDATGRPSPPVSVSQNAVDRATETEQLDW